MKSTRAAARYAKALLQLALERNEVERVKSDAENLLKTIANSRDLRLFLASPVVKFKQKQTILREIFENELSTISMHFVLLIAKQGREQMLPEIFESFIKQYKQSINVVDATVRASTAMSASTIASLKSKLETSLGKQVDLQTIVDEKLIGGYVIEMDNYRLDASMSGGLQKLKRELISKR